jgi:hypothetical protein
LEKLRLLKSVDQKFGALEASAPQTFFVLQVRLFKLKSTFMEY